MRIACFCGTTFESDDEIARCPASDEPACVPGLTFRDMAEMACDVAEILAEHEPAR